MTPGRQDDASLVIAALAGQQGAYTLLLDRHRDAVFRIVRAQVRSESDAIDITQETFIAAFAALARYDPARPLRGWLARIALNKCRDWARRRAVRRLFTFARPLDDALDVADPGANPEVAAHSAREVARIRQAIADLPAQLREALVLCTIEGFSQDEAAAILGTSRKAVETRVYRARQKLSEVLEGS
jgi:RNA polymerase sigma-70 factor (ECF subfamily)